MKGHSTAKSGRSLRQFTMAVKPVWPTIGLDFGAVNEKVF
jgi:hypothetical protein